MSEPYPVKLHGSKISRRFNGAIARCACIVDCEDTWANCDCIECTGIGGPASPLLCGLWLGANTPPADPDYGFEIRGYVDYNLFLSNPEPYPAPLNNGAPQSAFRNHLAISPMPCGYSSAVLNLSLVDGENKLFFRVAVKKNGDDLCQWRMKIESLPSRTKVITWALDVGCVAVSGRLADFTGTIGVIPFYFSVITN